MAPNRQPEAKPTDPSSSDEEEEEGSTSEEEENHDPEKSESGSESEDEEEEEQQQQQQQLKTPPPVPQKPSGPKKKPELTTTPNAHPQSSSDSGSDSSSESDSPPRVDPNIKPIASKPMEKKEPPPKSASVAAATTKSRSKASSAAPAKRKVEEVNNSTTREPKRSKKAVEAVDADKAVAVVEAADKDSNKKQLFQRLWSEDDEIAILKGIMEYTAKKGADPTSDMNAFLEFIKKSLHVEVTRTQLSEKVRRLKKKYENNAGKGKKQGEDRTFSKPHEEKAYQLSKKIWGNINNGGGTGVGNDSTNNKANGRARKSKNQIAASVGSPMEGEKIETEEKGKKLGVEANSGVLRSIRFYGSIGELSLDEEIVKEGLELISDSKKLELEEKWKKLRVEEIELYLKRVDLIRERTKLFLEGLKSSGN